jgi:hypothetical protein
VISVDNSRRKGRWKTNRLGSFKLDKPRYEGLFFRLEPFLSLFWKYATIVTAAGALAPVKPVTQDLFF